MHWPVPVEVLRRLVPSRLALDLFDGVAYVGLIPFRIPGSLPIGAPRLLALNFLETNVRTYVRGVDGPGIYFFSLDAASLLAVAGARIGYGLPYFYARMHSRQRDSVVDYFVARRSRKRPRLRLLYEIGDPLPASEPGTLQHFLLERYILYVERLGTLWTAQVHHVPYPAQQAQIHEIQDELVMAAGFPKPEGAPAAVHYSPGVDVDISPPRIHLYA